MLEMLRSQKFNETDQNYGYKLFFTNENPDKDIVAMKYARATARLHKYSSNKDALDIMKNEYHSGALHFGVGDFKRDPNKVFFDLDIKNAYMTWCLNYGRGNFNYKVGGTKEYFPRYSWWTFRKGRDGVNTYRIKFVVVTNDATTSVLYRKWIVKTLKVQKLFMTKKEIGGVINIPNIQGMVNEFLKDVYAYEKNYCEILSVTTSSGDSGIVINVDNIAKAMRIKANPFHPENERIKLPMVSSTGYLAIADKILYYCMVNHVKSEVFRLIKFIEWWNEKVGFYGGIEIVAGNTDGITVYADPRLEDNIKSLLDIEVNHGTPFKVEIKEIYTLEDAHITPHDIKRRKHKKVTDYVS